MGEEKPEAGPEVWPGQRLNHSAGWKGKLGAWEVCFHGFLSPIREGISRALLIHLGPGSFTFNLYSERIKHSPSWRVRECLAPGFSPKNFIYMWLLKTLRELEKSATKKSSRECPHFQHLFQSQRRVHQRRGFGCNTVLFVPRFYIHKLCDVGQISQLLWVTSGGVDSMPCPLCRCWGWRSSPLPAHTRLSFCDAQESTLEKVFSAFDFFWQGFENWASLESR